MPSFLKRQCTSSDVGNTENSISKRMALTHLYYDTRCVGCLGSVVVALGLSCSVAGGIFLEQGSNLCPLHLRRVGGGVCVQILIHCATSHATLVCHQVPDFLSLDVSSLNMMHLEGFVCFQIFLKCYCDRLSFFTSRRML